VSNVVATTEFGPDRRRRTGTEVFDNDCEAMAVRVIAVHFRSSMAARQLARNFSRATGIALHRFLRPEDAEEKSS